jgi:glycosyltransferase involved in cell wall biosynthesis
MWHGLPVVASNIPCHSEQINDGVSGLLFRSSDPADLAEKLQRIIDDKPLRADMGKEAAKNAREFGDFKKIFKDQLMPLIQDVAETGSQRS